MSEWTPQARQRLDAYLKEVADLCRQGDDADEVIENLRNHVTAEVARDAAGIVTVESLDKALARVGTPAQVVGAHTAPDCPGPTPAGGTAGLSKLAQIARTQAQQRSALRRWMFVIFAVFVPLLAILVESDTHFLAEVATDPIPTDWHTLLLLLIPASFALGEIALREKAGAGRRWLAGAAFTTNGYALAVSSVYLIIYLPVMPIAVFAILLMGIGVLGLSPVFCTVGGALQMRRLYGSRERFGLARGAAVRRSVLGCVVAGAALLVLEGAPLLVNHAINLARSDEPAERARGLMLLRTLDAEDEVLRRCYGEPPRRGRGFLPLEGVSEAAPAASVYREMYFRLAGRPFNSVPPPTYRNRARGDAWRSEWEREWVADAEVGGTAVAALVRGLGLFSSVMTVETEGSDGVAGPCIAYVEWMLEFRNSSRREREARAQIALPPGGVACRLTLWIDGEEREAAFGGRSQVRAAYRDVAVVRRRDPALLTTAGRDRVLLQCFPVPAGGTMKVKVGIVAPLVVRGDKAHLRLPYFVERNFAVARDFAHDVRAGSHMKLRNEELMSADKGAVEYAAPAADAAYRGELGDAAARMRLAPPAQRHATLCLVVDGSGSMKSGGFIGGQALARAVPAGTRVAALFAGHEMRQWARSSEGFGVASPESMRDLAQWMGKQRFTGGCDPVPALERAWDMVAAQGGGAVLWVHGPLPELLSSPDTLKDRLRRPGMTLLSLTAYTGPNRVVEALSDEAEFDEVPVLVSLSHTLEYIGTHLRGEDVGRVFELALGGEGLSEAPSREVPVSGRLVLLAVYDRVLALLRSGGKDDVERARRLAVSTRLVTPVSGAVVLETKEQYARHQLNPSAEAKPEDAIGKDDVIPEPETWVLIGAGLVLLALHARRRRVRAV